MFFFLEQVMRIELTTTAWEAVVLPLNYTCARYLKKRKNFAARRKNFVFRFYFSHYSTSQKKCKLKKAKKYLSIRIIYDIIV